MIHQTTDDFSSYRGYAPEVPPTDPAAPTADSSEIRAALIRSGLLKPRAAKVVA